MTEEITIEASALEVVPLFPLPQAVLFPGMMLPLHIFEPRYRVMTREAVNGSNLMAVGMILEREEPLADGHPRVAPVVGLGRIVQHQLLQDGRSNIMLQGLARVTYEELPFVAPYRRIRCELAPTAGRAPSRGDVTALVSLATRFAAAVREREPNFHLRLPADAPPEVVADACAHYLLIDGAERQAVLEALSPSERVDRCLRALVAQQATLSELEAAPRDLN